MREKNIQNDILRRYGSDPRLRLWRQNVGVSRMGPDRVVRYGLPGQADLSGILPDGRRLEIEVKAPGGRPSPEQVAFGRVIETFNGVYILARSVADVSRVLEPILEKR